MFSDSIGATQFLTPIVSTYQPLPTGFDGGYGSAKLIVESAEVRIPSYVQPLHKEIYEIPESDAGSLIEYVSGERSDLLGTRWFGGVPAYLNNPEGHLRVVDDRRGKTKFGLQLLLAALGSLPYRANWNLALVASIQDAQALGAELRESLRGNHSIRINGKQVSTVDIKVLSVVEEGSGAIAQSIMSGIVQSNAQTILLDIGHGTIISSLFGQKGKLISRDVKRLGVDILTEAIAKNLETRRQLTGEGDRQIIRSAIENGSFNYGTTGWNFRQIYNAELPHWVQSALSPALKAVAPWRATSDAVIACGGGSQLPAIAQLLAKQGISVSSDGAWANCRGLVKIAQIKLQRRAG
ncbi:hypothetical protein H6S82_01065 [Planktothrix sp. FACHB-1355]|uniref:Actin-like protein N-terminal domain-containing protein n=1 Tax=Aerosakkonema funiforme FACHB-1375 TaxID=2949571 RepID=A0A926VIW8_9CYAN|nr:MULTISPECIES: hypothetical protein [Oscillatoriales]MBD2184811.1 hypothetical protein [Aerosakkonema funiforme FACHB-1375]MBD3557459.1 hypothetical protein [Planktothrix sp. FACHB-1355]